MSDDPRRAEIAANLAEVERRVDQACAAAGRDRAEVTVIAVTKTFPASDVAWLYDLGVRDVGENRHQEAGVKADACAGLTGLRWHFVGQLQTNKATAVARYADVVHSVDRERLVHALDRAAGECGRTIEALVQLDLRRPPVEDGRGGADPTSLSRLAEAVAGAEHLRLAGVMAVAPLGADPREAFDRLGELAAGLRKDHPDATVVSAGMSADLEQAVAAGATHLRVGSALLGSRPPLR
jgi:PLP dependent protein